MKSTLVSGIQPTGNLHIGNYLGAVKNWVDLQNSGAYLPIFFIADYHALTSDRSQTDRPSQILRTAAELLACGIDPQKSILFVQSDVSITTELAWIFNCVTPIAELERMTQYKDKSARQVENVNTGLFTYPVLQAADILLYRGTAVPVGQDQVQHVELTRDIARWFNNRFQNYFSEPKAVLTPTPKIMSLAEPTKKMSKSHGADSVLELADEPAEILRKVKKAVTATEGGAGAPGVANLLLLLKNFGDSKIFAEFDAAELAGTIRYGDLKEAVALAVANNFIDFRIRRADLLANPEKVHAILQAGADKAREIASKTITEVRQLVGLR